jgi:SpoVK/Ycf46/Vps4 family AAA+-type ATPase
VDLIQALQFIDDQGVSLPENAISSDISATVRDRLLFMYPGSGDIDLLSSDYLDITDDHQRNMILNTPLSELSVLVAFLRQQLENESYLFAGKGIELKQLWPPEVDCAFDHLLIEACSTASATAGGARKLTEEARQLETALIKHELLVVQTPHEALMACLSKAYRSNCVLAKQLPLLVCLTELATNSTSVSGGFILRGAHYVKLREKLRKWCKLSPNETTASSQKSIQSRSKSWDWCFLRSDAKGSINESEAAEAMSRRIALQSQFRPWFLPLSNTNDTFDALTPDKGDADATTSAEDVELLNNLRTSGLSNLTGELPAVPVNGGEEISVPTETEKSLTRYQGRYAQKKRRAGRGTMSLGAIMNQNAQGAVEKVANLNAIRETLQRFLNDSGPIAPSLLLEITQILVHEKDQTLANEASFVKEVDQKVRDVEILHRSAIDGLQNIPGPFSRSLLENALQRATEAGLSDDIPEVKQVQVLLDQVVIAHQKAMGLSTGLFIDCPTLRQHLELMRDQNFLCDEYFIQKLSISEAELLSFENNFSLVYGKSAFHRVVKSCELWHKKYNNLDGKFFVLEGLESSEMLRSSISGMVDKLQQNIVEAVDESMSMLERNPLSSWIHCNAYLAAACTAPTHIELYGSDASDYLEEYFSDESFEKPVAPAALLAVSRLAVSDEMSASQLAYRSACLRRCNVPEVFVLMTEEERAISATAGSVTHSAVLNKSAPPVDTGANSSRTNSLNSAEAIWNDLKSQIDAVPCPSIDALMEMIGLEGVKREVLQLYKSILAEQALPAKRRVPQRHNFVLLGNPGTGKTTVAKLLGKVLHELGVRKKDTFHKTTAEELLRLGSDKFAALLHKTMGGTLFIDEAYALHPASNGNEGVAIAMLLLDAAEEKRSEISIILAGYKEDIERKLFDFNDGFCSRFNFTLTFDDYSEAECGSIFKSLCSKHDWEPESDHVVATAARRISRGRGQPGFGNARRVLSLFEVAYKRALSRDKNATELCMQDILGPRPEPDSNVDLRKAFVSLRSMSGLASVKNRFNSLVELAQKSYDQEMQGLEPSHIPLNRVFLGNPGTGKTTVAALYCRILKGLGFLSDGQCELKKPGDFIGDVVGQTSTKTGAILKRCKGKCLVIDEAYGLATSSFGLDAITEIVSRVHGGPGEDIAIVMIGYEKEMKKMFRDCNPGLTSRFNLQDAVVFEDLDDLSIDRKLLSLLGKNFTLKAQLRKKVVASIAGHRVFPNFGNSRFVEAQFAQAKQRLFLRNSTSNEFSLSDFGIGDQLLEDWKAKLSGLMKVAGIISEFEEIECLIKQSKLDGKDPKDLVPNYVFVGSTGTGKTTIAVAMAKMLQSLGLVNGSFMRLSGLELQGSYVGQTKDKVKDAVDATMGGVLFIDEAYTLGGSSTFSREALDELVSRSEPSIPGRPVVILAGYEKAMESMLTNSNEGVRNRFSGRVSFPDWDANDCVTFLQAHSEKEGIVVDADAVEAMRRWARDVSSRPGWANARDCVTLYNKIYSARAKRLNGNNEAHVKRFIQADVELAFAAFAKQRPKEQLQHRTPARMQAAFVKEAPVQFAFCEENSLPMAPKEVVSSAPICKEEMRELEEKKEVPEEVTYDQQTDGNGMDPVFAALLRACKDEGYDDSHDRRKELVEILTLVEAEECDLPTPIMDRVLLETGLRSKAKVFRILRPQVGRVLGAMRDAVKAEEARLAELLLIEEEERRAALEAEHKRVQERLRSMGRCCMGFSWHPFGPDRWRCAGGSHYCTLSEIGI